MPTFPTLRTLTFLLFYFFQHTLNAQLPPPCPAPLPPAAASCQDACVYCDLDGYMGINDGPSGGNTICGGIQLQNDQWFGFVAGSSAITFQINNSDCMNGDGLQAAILDDCNFDALACQQGSAGMANIPVVISYNDFIPGRHYYLVIDGWAGDICSFEISVINGSVNLGPPGLIQSLQGPTKVCPGAAVEYTVPEVPNAGYYRWTAPPGSLINGQPNQTDFSAPGGNTVLITFGTSGGQVCVQAGNLCAGMGATACLNVVNQPIPPTVLPDLVVPHFDLPFFWGNFTITNSGIFTLVSDDLVSYLGCDSIVRQKLIVLPPYPNGAVGIVYADLNNNGVRDPFEPPYTAGVQILTSLGQSTVSLPAGYYVFQNIQDGEVVFAVPPTIDAVVHPPSHIMQLGSSVAYSFGIHIPPPPAGTLRGLVYEDANNNGQQDAGEGPLPGVVLESNSGLVANTGPDGRFEFPGLFLGDTLRVAPQGGSSTVQPTFRIVTADTLGYDFGVYFPPQVFDLRVDATNTSVFRQGFPTTVQITVKNTGAVTVQPAVLGLKKPAFLEYLDASPAVLDITGDSITWDLGAMAPGATRILLLGVKTALGTPNGTLVTITGTVHPLTGDLHPANNRYVLQTAVVGSYDPNDKQVNPAYVTPAMLNDDEAAFEYTIRFQNTGNYPATFIRIIDTLGFGVDPASFRLIAGSHDCTWKINADGILKFFFDEIYLPDSVNNEPESHGFVKFALQPTSYLGLGDVVSNFCDIYFDYNEPIRTNTAGTQVVYFLPGDLPAGGDELKVRPNPAGYLQQFGWETPAPAGGVLRYFDILGLPRAQTQIPAGATNALVDVSLLPPGAYLAVLDAGGLYLTRAVLVHRGGLIIGK